MKHALLVCSWLITVLLAPSFAAVPDALIHHWNFDEGPDWHDDAFQSVSTNTLALDCTGGAHATMRNMGGSNWVSGRQFTALQFDGVSQHLVLATNLAGTLGATASFSFCVV